MEEASPILFLGLLLVCGLTAGLLASRLGLPRVAAYVLAGMPFSERLLGGLFELPLGEWSRTLTFVALGVIAYLIGGSITLAQLRRVGGVILAATLGEGLGAALAVLVAVLLFSPQVADLPSWRTALALAAIAVSTAPAGTLAVLHQYRARGPLSTTLLGVVALDDALGVILFSLVSALASGNALGAALVPALGSLAGGVALGLGGGFLLARLGPRVPRAPLRLPMALGTILLVIGLARTLGSSELLAAMSLGFSGRLLSGAQGERLLIPIEFLEETVFAIFFTLAGAHFDPVVFAGGLGLTAVYCLARVAGKTAGAALGARLAGAPPSITRWLGLGLVPQAGVAIGLALSLTRYPAFAEGGRVLVNVILGTTLIYELAGPFALRLALARAGELGARRGVGRSAR